MIGPSEYAVEGVHPISTPAELRACEQLRYAAAHKMHMRDLRIDLYRRRATARHELG